VFFSWGYGLSTEAEAYENKGLKVKIISISISNDSCALDNREEASSRSSFLRGRDQLVPPSANPGRMANREGRAGLVRISTVALPESVNIFLDTNARLLQRLVYMSRRCLILMFALFAFAMTTAMVSAQGIGDFPVTTSYRDYRLEHVPVGTDPSGGVSSGVTVPSSVAVPEPNSWALLLFGGTALAAGGIRRFRSSKRARR